MPDIRGLVSDPDFDLLSPEDKKDVLQRAGADPGFIRELLGEPEPPTFLETLRSGMRQAAQTKVPGIVSELAGPYGGLFRDPITREASVEQGLENVPAVTGAVGALLGGPPGAVAGAAGGEALRQTARRVVGLPAATGMLQRHLGLDPDSTDAAAAGIGMEMIATPVGEGVGKIAGAAADFFNLSSLRSLKNLLQPQTKRQTKQSLKLGQTMKDEGIAPPLSTRQSQLDDAEKRLEFATREVNQAAAPLVAADSQIPAQPIIDRFMKGMPELRPDGTVPETGMADRNAFEKVKADVLAALGGGNQRTVSLATALAEKERWDKMNRRFYKLGTETPSAGEKEYAQDAADAFRMGIRDAFPELGEKLIKKSELVTITNLLRDALENSRISGTPAGEEGAALGATVAGRLSIPAMSIFKRAVSAGPVASFSSAAKSLLAGILESGVGAAQAWVRIADQFNVPLAAQDPATPSRPEDKALQDLAKMILEKRSSPAEMLPTVTEEEFMARYQ